jgi:hypothetical protein
MVFYHSEASQSPSVKRSENKSYSGKMVPIGGRVPAGGRPGDSYVLYSSLRGDSRSDIESLFHHAYVS